jgi:hypothetical protein
MLFDKLKLQFPELELVGFSEGPEDPDDVLVNVIMPDDEDREIAVRGLAAEISTDILMDYGYLIIISSASKEEKIPA